VEVGGNNMNVATTRKNTTQGLNESIRLIPPPMEPRSKQGRGDAREPNEQAQDEEDPDADLEPREERRQALAADRYGAR